MLHTLAREPLGEPAEHRMRRLRSAGDRDDFSAARRLAKRAAEYAGESGLGVMDLRQRCDSCGGEHGRPVPTAGGWHVSWGHSRGYVVAGVSRSRLGVDIESHAPDVSEIAETVLTPRERVMVDSASDPSHSFLSAWTAKEALVKAGVCTLDDVGQLKVLRTSNALLPHQAGFALSAAVLRGAVAAAATREDAQWFGLDKQGNPRAMLDG